MKKRLESELISIAHRILKLKNKSEVNQLYIETQKLYETLATLKFYQDNFEQVKSTVSIEELESKLENPILASFDIPKTEIVEEHISIDNDVSKLSTEDIIEAEKPSEIESTKEEVSGEESKSDFDFEPIFELAAETPQQNIEENIEENIEKNSSPKKQEPQQISFEDLLGQNYSEPVFVKPNDVSMPVTKTKIEVEIPTISEKVTLATTTLNDKFANNISVGLNDKIAFVKNLFADSNEDYNRVISQLNTFDSLQEAQEFIDDMVKPDYNNWVGKEEYTERFMEIIEKKFS
ncbi:MAG: hypothetical protein H7239_08730 [Flavobacterium sp.]|nr:hypothetical protein [Flavobacterium sp.]